MALRGVATAALDVSDGLTGDLGHIVSGSQVRATIELAAVPRSPALAAMLAGAQRPLAIDCLLAGGDDYELCFTAPPAAAHRLASIAVESGVALTRIGTLTAGAGLVVRDERGVALPVLPGGFDHFAPGA
jgi:thiamine-monophosphate kinase